MDLKLDDEAMQTFVAKSIFDSFTPEHREAMVQQAIKAIMAKPANPGSYGDNRSVLQRAFDNAADTVAHRIINKHLSEDAAFETNVKALLAEAVEHAFNVEGGGRAKMVEAISAAIVAGLRPKETY